MWETGRGKLALFRRKLSVRVKCYLEVFVRVCPYQYIGHASTMSSNNEQMRWAVAMHSGGSKVQVARAPRHVRALRVRPLAPPAPPLAAPRRGFLEPAE